jgi:hypothetical protein
MLAPKRIFILLVNAGTDSEGIHTIQMGGRNKVLMFESEDDALRYALMLEAQDFPSPTVEGFPPEEIEEFCEEAGYDCELIEAGRLELPPEANVEQPDWQGQEAVEPHPRANAEAEVESNPELDAIRRRLEGLL